MFDWLWRWLGYERIQFINGPLDGTERWVGGYRTPASPVSVIQDAEPAGWVDVYWRRPGTDIFDWYGRMEYNEANFLKTFQRLEDRYGPDA